LLGQSVHVCTCFVTQAWHVAITVWTPLLRMFPRVMGGPCFSRASPSLERTVSKLNREGIPESAVF
jgi:hypothetical protein